MRRGTRRPARTGLLGAGLLAVALLAGCADGPTLPKLTDLNPFAEKAVPLPGKRIPVMQAQEVVTGELADGSHPILLPPQRANEDWSQPGGAPNNTLPRHNDQQTPLVKVDWLASSNNTVSITYNYMRWSNPNAIQTPAVLGNVGRNGTDDVRIHSLNGRLTTVFGSGMVNEIRMQWGRDFEYPLDYETARVSKLGRVHFSCGAFFVSTALLHQLLGLEWTEQGDWALYFGTMRLGTLRRIKGRHPRVRFIPVGEVSPMSPDNLSPMSVK